MEKPVKTNSPTADDTPFFLPFTFQNNQITNKFMNFHDFLCEKAMTNPLPTQFSSMNPILKRLNFPNKFYLELYVWISLPEKNALQEISTERPKPHIIFLNLKNAVSFLTGGLAKSVRSFSSAFCVCVCLC